MFFCANIILNVGLIVFPHLVASPLLRALLVYLESTIAGSIRGRVGRSWFATARGVRRRETAVVSGRFGNAHTRIMMIMIAIIVVVCRRGRGRRRYGARERRHIRVIVGGVLAELLEQRAWLRVTRRGRGRRRGATTTAAASVHGIVEVIVQTVDCRRHGRRRRRCVVADWDLHLSCRAAR